MSEDPNTITGIWQELRSHRDMLVRMETKLEAVSSTLPDHETRIRRLEEGRDAIPDHESRMRRLEERRFPLQTLAVLVATASLMLTAVLYVVANL